MSAGRRRAMLLKMVALEVVPVSPVPMTGVGLGRDRRELNGHQQDRRSKHSQKRAGRSHKSKLPYGPGQGNNG